MKKFLKINCLKSPILVCMILSIFAVVFAASCGGGGGEGSSSSSGSSGSSSSSSSSSGSSSSSSSSGSSSGEPPVSYGFAWRKTGLNNPCNMTFNVVTGEICVANYGDNNIARFDTTGNRLSDITDPSFDHPQGVASDSTGNHYIVNGGIKKIIKLDSNWSNKVEWVLTKYPNDIAAEYGNHIVVLETQNGTNAYVEVFDRNGIQQYFWQINGANTALGIAITPDGSSLYITDTYNHRVLKYLLDGTGREVFGSQGTENGQFEYPKGIDIGSDGKIYIIDNNNFRFQVFNPQFEFIGKYIASQGNGDGQFQDPYGIAVDFSSNVYVTDNYSTTNNIQKFAPNQ